MKKIVVDSGIVVKWCVSEADSDRAQLIYNEYASGNLEFFVPSLLYAEIGNIIWKKRMFQNLSETNAENALNLFRQVAFIVTPVSVLFDEAFEIAVQYKRTFYDSLYLALARRENCDFVTPDEKLLNALGSEFPNAVLLSDWK